MGSMAGQSPGGQQPNNAIAHGPENPNLLTADQQEQQFQFPEGYQEKILATIQAYRDDWAPNRLLRIPDWMRNVLMFRGSQLLGWDAGQNTYFDALAWYRQSGRQEDDGDDTYLDRYSNNITQMLGEAFVGTMSRAVPPTLVRPENAEILADVTTAKAAQEAISIIERMNDIHSMVLDQNHNLYLYGVYFKYTRATMDSAWGYDDEDVFGQITVSKPDRYHCYGCGKDTPVEAFGPNEAKSCPFCNKPPCVTPPPDCNGWVRSPSSLQRTRSRLPCRGKGKSRGRWSSGVSMVRLRSTLIRWPRNCATHRCLPSIRKLMLVPYA